MSKSKYNYKVYNGKALKKIFENSRIYLFAVIFAIGIVAGAIVIGGDSELILKIKNLTDSFVQMKSQQGIAENFCNSVSVSVLFMIINVFFGFSLVGYPFLIWLPFLRGMGIGVVTGYFYSVYKALGLGYCVLIIYPGAIVSTLAFILACNDSCEYSKNAFQKAIKGRGQFEKDETKVYFIRQIIFMGICAASSVIDAIFSASFSGFFEI